MDNDTAARYKILVGLTCFAGFLSLFWMLTAGMNTEDATVKLALLVIVGIMALFATLALVAVTFSMAGLTDGAQALGLPEGSIRAAIALALIVIFSIAFVFLYTSIAARPDNAAANDFAKQSFTVIGTLMTSTVSYYFATRGAVSATETPRLQPQLVSVSPAQATRTAGAPVVVPVEICGTGLQLARTVRFEMGGTAMPGANVMSNDELVTCDVSIDPGVATGTYDVVVTATDGTSVSLPKAFEVK